MRGERGAAAVEMALILPLLFMLVFGIVVYGITLFRTQGLEAAVREGGRLAAVSVDKQTVTTKVADSASSVGFQAADLAITFAVDGTDQTNAPGTTVLCQTGGSEVQVGVSLLASARPRYELSLPLLPAFTPPYAAEATFRCE